MSAFWSDRTDSGVYQIRNSVNGKKYIGSTVNFRIRSRTHFLALSRGTHHSVALQRSWDKYGAHNFVFEVVEACPPELLIEREQRHIDAGASLNCCKVAGSTLGRKHSESTRQKIAARAVGRKMAPRDAEYRKKLSDIHAGKPKPAHVMDALQRGRRNAVFTDARKKKVGDSLRRAYETGVRSREKSHEHRAKIGRTVGALSDADVRAIRLALENGETGRSLAIRFNINASTISEIKNRKTYLWVD